MIRYGDPVVEELIFERLKARVEPRDEQWVDVEISFALADGKQPEDVEDLSALIICTRRGDVVQIVPQDEGRDCEFQFTEGEKEQLRRFFDEQVRGQFPLLG
ncbi:hypothetical protein RAC89_01545 [Paenibacillus sp. GD4]|uniref:hypothetical protein n=1 Tax=Paenibacillus sp. GD4 TaxID=3068890 RepID=UPI0027968BF7|nr:hypothetical protein [Paenibacillus sp. GD4]MDQ1909181.1 hypothetical protein [Paenibacillus sp. GD4]